MPSLAVLQQSNGGSNHFAIMLYHFAHDATGVAISTVQNF